MSIQSEINRLVQAKQNIIAAITSKGVTVPTDSSLDDLTALVQAIETGSDPVLQSKTVTPSTSKQTVTPDSGYDGLSSVTVNAMASGAMSEISVSNDGVITSGIKTSGYLASDTNVTKELSTQAAKTVTPTTSNQTAVASGRYTTGAVTVKGDSNLVADNIKKGTSIFGITGTYEGSGGAPDGGAETMWATGVISVGTGTKAKGTTFASVDGLGFKPTHVIFYPMVGFELSNVTHFGLTFAQAGVRSFETLARRYQTTQATVSAFTSAYAEIEITDDGFNVKSKDNGLYTGSVYEYIAIYDSSYVAGGDDGGDDGDGPGEEEIPGL